MKKALLFDIYGTMIDIRTDEHDPSVYEALSRYLAYLRVFVQPEELKNAFLQQVHEALKRSKEVHPEVDVFRVFEELLRRFGRKKPSEKTVLHAAVLFRSLTIRTFGPFPGILEALPVLRKTYRMAIVSDAQWVFTEPEIQMLGLDRFFKVILLSSRFGFKKPDPRLFHLALDLLGVSPKDSVYIGDNPQKDLVGAKTAGMSFLLFQGEGKEVNGFRPDGILRSYFELPDLLRKMK